VDTTTDSNDAAYQQCTAAPNDCSLRGAISKANSGAATEYAINLSSATYTLTVVGDDNASGDLDVAKDIIINGVDADRTIIQAGTTGSNGIDRVFHVINSSVDLTLNDVTVRYGLSTPWGWGGGIYNNSGRLNINNSVISDNHGRNGGGIYNNGTVNIKNSTISGNSAEYYGGGIYIDDNILNIQSSTISDNYAGSAGGGIAIRVGSTLNAGNVTISDNHGVAFAGAIDSFAGIVNLSSSTISGNYGRSHNSIYLTEGVMELQNTIITSPREEECAALTGAVIIGKGNLIDDTSCGSGSSFRLGAVTYFDTTRRDNGGPTETHALLAGSNAIDAVSDCTYVSDGNNPLFRDNETVSADQRGVTRPRGGLCDVGAYESPYILWDGGGGADTDTTTAANWSGDFLPAATDIPVFDDSASSNSATVDNNLTVGGWVINTGYSGAISQGSYDLTVNGDWQQLGGTFAGGSGAIDIDGVFDLSNGSFTAPAGLMTVFGGFHHTGGTFDPNGGRVMLHNATDQTLVTSGTFHDLTLKDGLLGYWKLDDGAGTTVTDSSGYGHDGTFTHGSPSWSTDVPGSVAFHDPYALDFTRADSDRVYVPNTSDIDEMQQFTLAAWVKLTTMDAVVMRFVTLGGEKACLRYDGASGGGPGQLQFFMQDENSNFYNTRKNGALDPADGWVHVAGTYDGSTMRLYLDGVEQDTTDVSATLKTGNGVVFSSTGEGLDGLLDNVRVYDRALSVAEIGDLPNNGLLETGR
jgi:hypothetical protein